MTISNSKTIPEQNARPYDDFIEDHLINIVNADDYQKAHIVLMDIITDVKLDHFKYFNEKQQETITNKKKRLTEILLTNSHEENPCP